MAVFNIYPTAEGIILAFETEDGETVVVSAEAIAETLPPAARETVLKWCGEVRDEVGAIDLEGELPVRTD